MSRTGSSRKRAGSRSARWSRPSKNDEAVGERLLALPPLGRAAARERLLAARDEPAGHAVDHARVQVVVAHELLDAAATSPSFS